MAPALAFKQAVGSAHRAVVDIKVHFERLHAVGHWIECWGDRFLYAQTRTDTVAERKP
jgi:hypothetical protein